MSADVASFLRMSTRACMTLTGWKHILWMKLLNRMNFLMKGGVLMIWRTAGELLQLFGVDTSQTGARYFIDLVELLSCTQRFHPVRFKDLVSVHLRDLKVSPLIYWSQQRRAVRPLLEADADTLRALGVKIVEPPQTTAALVQAVAATMAATYSEDDSDLRMIADGVAALCLMEV